MLIALIGNSAESMINFRGSLLRRLAARGHTVVAFAPNFDAETRSAVERLGATPRDFPLNRRGVHPAADLATIAALRRSLSELRPDATLCYFIKPAIYGTLAAALTGVPRRLVMLEGLGYGFAVATSFRQRVIGLIVPLLLRLALSSAHRVLVLNEEDRVALVEKTGIVSAKVVNMGGIGVELDQFAPAPVREQATTFAMAARLIEEKGVRDYVEVARRIRRDDQGIRFLLLGDVDDNPSSLTREQVAIWKDEGIIDWPGQVSDIQNWLKQADVFVLPSYYREGVPRSIQEAMALGRAIITTDHVGCRDTVEQGINGLLVRPKDVEALEGAMRVLIETPGLARRMGKQSRRIAAERFDAKKADCLVIALLEKHAQTSVIGVDYL